MDILQTHNNVPVCRPTHYTVELRLWSWLERLDRTSWDVLNVSPRSCLELAALTSHSRHSNISVSSPSRDSNDSVSASYVSFTTLLNALSKVSIAAEVTGITWCWNSLRHISLLACQNWMQLVTRYLRTEGATEILWYFSSILCHFHAA